DNVGEHHGVWFEIGGGVLATWTLPLAVATTAGDEGRQQGGQEKYPEQFAGFHVLPSNGLPRGRHCFQCAVAGDIRSGLRNRLNGIGAWGFSGNRMALANSSRSLRRPGLPSIWHMDSRWCRRDSALIFRTLGGRPGC